MSSRHRKKHIPNRSEIRNENWGDYRAWEKHIVPTAHGHPFFSWIITLCGKNFFMQNIDSQNLLLSFQDFHAPLAVGFSQWLSTVIMRTQAC